MMKAIFDFGVQRAAANSAASKQAVARRLVCWMQQP
jgi:hypothetical protein